MAGLGSTNSLYKYQFTKMALHKWFLKMANYSHLFLLFVTFFVPRVLAGTNYTVGDKSGWNLGVDYFSWTSDKTFFVGDNLGKLFC